MEALETRDARTNCYFPGQNIQKCYLPGHDFEPVRNYYIPGQEFINYYIPGQNLEPPRAKSKSYYIPGQKMIIAIYRAMIFEPADAP